MNSLDSQKKILVAESELNRAQLVQEWRTMVHEGHALADQARTVTSLVSAATSLAAGLMSLRRRKSAVAAEKPPWWQTILKVAQVAGSLWSEFRPANGGEKDK